MFRVAVTDNFESGHFLRNYRGKCENVHGHNYKIEVFILAENLNETGLAVDFGDVRMLIRESSVELDHTLLNEHSYFKEKNPSAENIAKYFYEKLSRHLPKIVSIEKVRIWETDRQWAEYFETKEK